jgi:hypothetical protein
MFEETENGELSQGIGLRSREKAGDKASSEERREITERMKMLEETSYRHVEKEMNKLKEMIILLEAEQ